MWRRLFAIVLLFGVLGAPSAAAPLLQPAEEFFAYFPVAARSPLPIEFVVTARGETVGYPTHYYVYGYVRSLIAEQVDSVVIEIDVTIYSYDPWSEGHVAQYTEAIRVSPALTATLPNQINPFAWDLYLGKASASIGEVRAVDARRTAPDGRFYRPLTIVGWHAEGTTVVGSVRNDHSHTLHNVRVVVVEPHRCAWEESTLADTTLQPGQEAAFHLNLYTTYCFTDDMVVVGQGAIQR
jgi:hypothetical protein